MRKQENTLKQLFIHEWKEKIRSPFWQKSVLLNILLGFLGLYFAATLVLISSFSNILIKELYPNSDIIKVFTGLLFYYFSADLMLRFLFQQLPTISIQPYLTLPIKKSQLLHYPILKSLSSFFNLFAVLLILPFFLKNICSTQSILFGLVWIISVFSLVAINNFLNFSFKKYFSKKPFLAILIMAVLGLLIYLDIDNTFSLSEYFAGLFYYTSTNTYLIVLPISVVALSYYLAHSFLRRNAYIEDSQTKATKKSTSLNFLGQYGEIGHLISVELKLILRNKRPKSLLYFSGIFILYGFMFYKAENMDNYLILGFTGLLLPSMFTMNYGQFLFSWESSYFDRILVSSITPYNYLRSKHLFLSFACMLGYFIILPYAFISYKIAFINAAFLLFNVGISTIILLFFCTFNSSYIELGKGQFMNYQGTGLTQFFVMIPIMGVPLLIYYLHYLFGGLHYYYYTIAIIGFLGIILNKHLLQLIVRRFLIRKYKMALGFRQK
jgi:hypothetical protein